MKQALTRRFFRCLCGKLHCASTLARISWRGNNCPQCHRDLIPQLFDDN